LISYFDPDQVCGEVEAMEIVLEAGADPATADIHGAYPIHYAAQMCGQLKKQISSSPSSKVHAFFHSDASEIPIRSFLLKKQKRR